MQARTCDLDIYSHTEGEPWLKVYVDAGSREVFAYQIRIVSGDRTAVPAPTPGQ
jgi:hypothetical protein